MQADEVQNAKEPIAAQIDLSGQTLRTHAPRIDRVPPRGESSVISQKVRSASPGQSNLLLPLTPDLPFGGRAVKISIAVCDFWPHELYLYQNRPGTTE